MSRSPWIERTAVAAAPGRARAHLLRLALFFAVEGAAELCRRRLVATPSPAFGDGSGLVAALMTMAWAYAAHRRLAFRHVRPPGALAALLVFEVLSLGCLDAQAIAVRAWPDAAVLIWLAVIGAKQVLAERLVWPDHAIRRRARA